MSAGVRGAAAGCGGHEAAGNLVVFHGCSTDGVVAADHE